MGRVMAGSQAVGAGAPIMPKATPKVDLDATFMPPFSIEVRRSTPEQTVNYDPDAKVKKSPDKR